VLIVKTYIAESPIHGNGVFASEDIFPGTVIWTQGAEILYSEEIFARLSDFEKDFISVWGWKDKLDGFYHLPLDNDRFINHSVRPNTGFDENGLMIAARFIARGEEILCDYSEFEEEFRFAKNQPAAVLSD
jgi:uncharacterized protein